MYMVYCLRLDPNTTQKRKFSIKDFFSKCDRIRSFLRIWSHLLKKFLMESFIFCAVKIETFDDRNSLCADADFEANSKQNLMIMG